MKKVALLLLAVVGAIALTQLVMKRRSAEASSDSVRAEQEADDGTPVVQEWGEESFPASDPPQSW